MDPSATTPAEMLAHAQWLRRLALRLAGDEATADDLVQETWLAALRRPPRRGGLRPWLTRVITNVVRQRRRSASRRLGHELNAARPVGDVPSAEDLALRLELEQRLLRAVGELRDPYKTVLLLRYEEGLTAVEISSMRGLPAATVRTQLSRALEKLRRRMDEESGGRGAWAALLAPGVNVLRTGGISATAEVTLMSSTNKIGIAGAAVLLTLVGAWMIGGLDGGGGTQVADVSESVQLDGPAARELETDLEEFAPDAAREAVAPLEAQAVAKSTALVFAARVVDGRGTPIEGARIAWLEGGSDPVASSADGGIELRVDRAAFGVRGTVRVEAAGYLSLDVELVAPQEERSWLGDMTLEGGATLGGIVLDSERLPVADARVVLTWSRALNGGEGRARREGPGMPDLWDGSDEQLTDSEGRFEFRSFETGTRMLWVGKAGYLWTLEGPFEVAAGESRDLTLILEPAARELRIRGVVLDSWGEGVPNAHLWYFDDPGRGKRAGKADRAGQFDLLLEVDRPHTLRAVDPEGRYPEVALHGVAPGSTEIVLRFVETRQLTVIARGADGEPVPIEALFCTNESDNNIITSGVTKSVPAEGGVLLEPAERFLVKIHSPGHAEGSFGPFAPGALGERAEFALEPVQQVLGTVLHEGRPVPGARVELNDILGPGMVAYYRGFRVTRSPFESQRVVTDLDGRFAVTPRDKANFFIRVMADGLAPAEEELRGFDPEHGEDLVFELTQGGTIHGELRALPGERPTGLIVAASRGDAHEKTMRVGPDGLFRFETLMPGPWLIEVVADDMSDAGATYMSVEDAGPLEWNINLDEGEEEYFELDLSAMPRASVQGRLVINGVPATHWVAGLRPFARPSGRPSDSPQTVLDDGGGFELETAVLGRQILSITAPEGEFPLSLSTSIELGEGLHGWNLELETGSIELEGVPAETHEIYRPHILWKGANGASSRINLTPTDGGSVSLESIPSGTWELIDYPEGPGGPPVVVRSVDVRPGVLTRSPW